MEREFRNSQLHELTVLIDGPPSQTVAGPASETKPVKKKATPAAAAASAPATDLPESLIKQLAATAKEDEVCERLIPLYAKHAAGTKARHKVTGEAAKELGLRGKNRFRKVGAMVAARTETRMGRCVARALLRTAEGERARKLKQFSMDVFSGRYSESALLTAAERDEFYGKPFKQYVKL